VVDDLTTAEWLVTTPVGEPLRRYLDKLPEEKRQAAILEVIQQVHEILCRAHSVGLVHGDCQPANFIIVPDEHGSFKVVVVDWGISVAVGAPLLAGVLAYKLGDFGAPACVDDDFTALGVTFIALVRGPPYCVPWKGAFSLKDMHDERSEWISGAHGWADIPVDVKERLPVKVLGAINALGAR
jgi:hypothetical protein